MARKDNHNVHQLFEGWAFGRINYFLFYNGEVNSFQSLTLAPILLFLGYIIVIPAALVFREKQTKNQ